MFVNSLVQAFFMPNAEELSEQVRTGGLDFALLKPIDTQFLVSLRRISWSSLGNFFVALLLLVYAVPRIEGLELSMLAGVALSRVHCDGGTDSLQRDDRLGGDEHLARSESVALRFLVLHHQLLALSDGNLRGNLGDASPATFHVCDPDSGGDQCAGPAHGQTTFLGSLLAGRLWNGCYVR